MKKILVSLSIIGGLFSINANAQTEFQIGITPRLPLGDFGKTHSFGIGGNLQAAYNFDRTVAATLTGEYTHYIGKKVVETKIGDVKHADIGHIPVMAGVRYTFFNSLNIHPMAGVTFSTAEKVDPAFSYGIRLGISPNRRTDVSVGYEAINYKDRADNVSLRLAFKL